MKKYFSIILIAAIAVSSIFSACKKEVVDPKDDPADSDVRSFVACIDDAAVKTTLDGVKVYWNTGDEVSLNGSIFVATVDEANPAKATFSLKEGETAPAKAEEYRVYYPASAYVDNQTSRFKLPESQTYAGNDISGVNPMFAYATSLDGTVHFKNVCGLLAIELMGAEKVKSITVSAPSDKYLYGTISDFAYNTAEDAITYSTFANVGRGSSVILNCAEAIQLSESEATRFYVAIPEAAYDNLTITVTVDSGDPFIFELNEPAEIQKNYIYTLPFTLQDKSVDISVELYSVSELFPKYVSKYPDETSLAFNISGKDIVSLQYGIYYSEAFDRVSEEGMSIQELVASHGGSMGSSKISKTNSANGLSALFEDLIPGTEYAFVYYATNKYAGEATGVVRKATKAIDYNGSLKIGNYTMSDGNYKHNFKVQPTTTDNAFLVKNLGYESGDEWNAVYDETAGTLTLDGTQHQYERYGNYFGTLPFYYDSSLTSLVGWYVYADAEDTKGTGPLVFKVDKDGYISGMANYAMIIPLVDPDSGETIRYLGYYTSSSTFSFEDPLQAILPMSNSPAVSSEGPSRECHSRLISKDNFRIIP